MMSENICHLCGDGEGGEKGVCDLPPSALAAAGRFMLLSVTELKARPELEHAGDPK